jgi:SAM-dependent methyltransferase
MADILKMDPARIARLRDVARLELVNPELALDVVQPLGNGPIVDVGAGVGYVSLPFARRLPGAEIIACDILEGMMALLAEDAAKASLGNLKTALMPGPTSLPLDDGAASMVIMLQVHHELDDAPGLMRESCRVLAPGAPIVIIDWKDEDLPGMPKGGRRRSAASIIQDLTDGGFGNIVSHEIYRVHSTIVGFAPAG